MGDPITRALALMAQCLRAGAMLLAAVLLFWALAGSAAGPWAEEVAGRVLDFAASLGPQGLTAVGALAALWILVRR